MKILTASAALFVLFLSLSVFAQTFPQRQDKYVNDFAGFLDSASVSELRGLLSAVERNTTAEVVVVILQTTEPETPSQYRTELFNNWKIGKAENDNGLLILYAVKEKRIEVEVGYGLEGILPDSKAGRILDEFYVPYRDKNQTVLGIVFAAQEFARVINANADEVRAGKAGGDFRNEWLGWLPLFFIIFFFAIIPLALSGRPPKCPQCGKRMKFQNAESDYEIYKCENGHLLKRRKRRHSSAIIAGGLGGGGFGGGGFGGGGGGFGGGGSGGGGAGR